MRKLALYEQLERENSELREDLKSREAALARYENVAGVPWDEYQHLLEKHHTLEGNHKRMKAQATQYKGAADIWQQKYETCRVRYDQAKEEVKKWIVWAETVKQKQEMRNTLKTGSPSAPGAGSTITAIPSNSMATPDLRLPTPRMFSSSPSRGISRLRIQPSARALADSNLEDEHRPATSAEASVELSKVSEPLHSPQSKDWELPLEMRNYYRPSQVSSRVGKEPESTVIAPPPAGHLAASAWETEEPGPSPHIASHSKSAVTRETPSSSATFAPPRFDQETVINIPDKDEPAPTVEQETTFVPPSLTSTQSTEGETIRERSTPPAEIHYHLQGDDDKPEVVSTRILRPNVLKRKRGPPNENNIVTPSIKKESSRGGLTHDSVRRLQPDQSIEDLDTIPGTVLTPRKYRQLQRIRSNSQGRINYAGRPPPSLNQLRSSSLPLDVPPDQTLRGSFREELRSSAPAVGGNQVNADTSRPILIDHDEDNESDMLDSPSRKAHPQVLRPISTNSRPALPRTSEKIPHKKRRYDSQTLASKLDDLAEDGGRRAFHQKDDSEQQGRPSTKTPRIENMLEAQTSKKPVLAGTPIARRTNASDTPVTAIRTSRAPADRVGNKNDAVRKPRLAETPSGRSPRKSTRTPVTVVRTRKTPSLVVKDTFDGDESDTRPEDEPLRLRPVASLTLNDFKINPTYNHGLDYAFSEVIRNRDERQCLPGCTRPDCCGNSFRKVIEIGGALAGPKPGLWDNNEDLEADQRLLEQYLGSDARNRLRRMTMEQKKEMLMEAHVERMAQKHGRHKAAFARRVTPPGFWDADFPSSQEAEKNKRRAEEMEREKVQERYNEAMRDGGRWMFRDE